MSTSSQEHVLFHSLFFVAMFVRFVIFVLIGSLWQTNASRKFVIDHDGGADDSMAIFLALLYEKYFDGPEVVAITTSHGNVDEPQTYVNTQKILDIAQRRDVPIYRGSNFSLVSTHPSDHFFGFDGLSDLPNMEYQHIEAQPQHAVRALIELSQKYEGELTIVTLGALTNIALAIRMDPHFIGRLAHIYAAAGNMHNMEFSTGPEYNVLMDVEGYFVFLQNSIPDKVTLIFADLLDRSITMEWRKNVLGAIDTPIMQAQNKFETIANAKTSPLWHLLDPQAMAIALNQSLAQYFACDFASVVLCGDDRGMDENSFTDCENPNVKVAYPPSKEESMSFLLKVFSVQECN